MDDKVHQRFLSKIDQPDGEGGCWVWVGGVNGAGYPQLRVGGRVELAHRLAYIHAGGEYPPGMESRRICGVKLCVNPAHIRIQRKDAEARVGVDDPHYHVWIPVVKTGGGKRPAPKHPVTDSMTKVGKAFSNRAAAAAAIEFYSVRKPRYHKGKLVDAIGARWQGSYLSPQISECLDPACPEIRRRRVAAGLPEYDPAVLERYGRRRWGAVPRRGAGKRARQVAAEKAEKAAAAAAKAADGIPSP